MARRWRDLQFLTRCQPKTDSTSTRIKALVRRAFTPKAIAQHQPEIRAISGGVLDGLDGREECDLVLDVAQPVVTRNPEHQAFGAGGRHLCLGTALARLELQILAAETVQRFPNLTLAGEPAWVVSQFSSQLRHLPVRLHG